MLGGYEMKTKWMLTLLLVLPMAAFAGETKVTLEGGGIAGTFAVTTNETSCGRLNWEGAPEKKNGKMIVSGGGQYEISVQLVNGEVVLKERTQASNKGIRSDITAKTTIPQDNIPWTGKISQTTVTVFRDQNKKEDRPPNKEPEATR
jgi:hypothetical protein